MATIERRLPIGKAPLSRARGEYTDAIALYSATVRHSATCTTHTSPNMHGNFPRNCPLVSYRYAYFMAEPLAPAPQPRGLMPPWWDIFRRVAAFLLGVAVIIDALIESNSASVGKLVVGLIMVGVLPLDDLITLARRKT